MFNRQIYENSRPDGVGLLEVVGQGEGQEERLFVPLKRTELRGEINGPLAALRLVHTYGYSREQCDQVLEAVYRFPLPGDAAVTEVRVAFGQVEIVTELKEREQAESEYEEAAEQGKQAALLARESADVFTLRVAGLQPDQPVVVETTYVQLARAHGDEAGWQLRVPLTTAPRYVREDEAGSRPAQGQPLALLRDPGHRFSLDVLFRDVGEVASPTHRLDALPEGSGYDRRVRLHDEEVVPDQDLVLNWTPHQEQERPALSVLLHHDSAAKQIYFMAQVAPPGVHEPGTGAAREVILLVDHSGSMDGAKWESADWTVNSFLSTLSDGDLFALGLFHSTTKWFAPKLRAATSEHLQRAAQYLDENRDSGGTNLGVALEQALRLKRSKDEGRARHVLIVTDAQVSDAARILRLADKEAKHAKRRRINVLCIDAAPNAFLANELAERGGGVARFLTSSPDQEDITTALEDVLADWAEPVQVGLRLEVNRRGGQAAGKEVSEDGVGTVIDLGDLPSGRAIWVAGRFPAERSDTLAFRLKNRRETAALRQLSVTRDAGSRPALKSLFGARRILGLEYLMNARYQGEALNEQLERLGYDPQEVTADPESAVYAENAYLANHKVLKSLLVRESLAYGLACAETAFVAVRKEAGKPAESQVVVANALPVGWSEDSGGGLRSMGMAPPSAAMPLTSAASGMAKAGLGMGAMMAKALGALRSPTRSAPVARTVSSRDRSQQYLSVAGAEGRKDQKMREAPSAPVFSGVPAFAEGRAILFDSTQTTFPDEATISRITVQLTPAPDQVDRDLALLVFVGDMAVPRARIRLAGIVRLGGERPMNLRKRSGETVRIVLVDPKGKWPSDGPEIRVTLTT